MADLSDYCYLWQKDCWRSLTNSNIRNAKSNVILLTGPRGSGKLNLANNLAKWLLCYNPNNINNYQIPCGKCQSCVWKDSNSHPDYYDVNANSSISASEKTSKKSKPNIKIDDIRELNVFLSLQPSLSRPKVVVINNIDKLTDAVANSLLKPLESYPIYTILLADNYNYILPTIRSRSQRWHININYDDNMKKWLLSELGEEYIDKLKLYWYVSGGAPLFLLDAYKSEKLSEQYLLVEALLKTEDPWFLIDKYLSESLPLIWVLNAMYYILLDILKYKIANNIKSCDCLDLKKLFPDLLLSFSKKTSIKAIECMLDQINIFKQGFLNPASIHDDLMLESLFIQWYKSFSASSLNKEKYI